MSALADIDAVVARAMGAWRPPPRLSLSMWADRYFVLSAESAAEPGRWHTLPYQREIMDSITDPSVTQVSVMKSARVGYSLMMSSAIGYFMHQDPSSILVVQPTVDDAKNFSKETIAPMLRDVPVLSRLLFKDIEEKGKGPKDSSATLQHKAFPGGILSLIGANSGSGFRRVSRRVIMFDEVDAYPPSAGSEGDQINLGMKRSEAFHNRKIISGSTPLVAGSSRIEELFLAGDQRRYFVPCPTCGHMDFLVFERKADRGHVMKWPDGEPSAAYFECSGAGCRIEHKDKRWMIERGAWHADNPGAATRSYHLWSALSYSPNASWGQIATEFLEAKRGGPEKLKTFVNTTLGETWKERGDAPDWERLYARREKYAIGSVPVGPIVLTAGVDVQKDRFVFEVVGWAVNKESWSIDAGEIHGDTSLESTWQQLDELLNRAFLDEGGAAHTISMLAIDSGYNTQVVYGWARQYPMSRVIACKGVSGARMLVGSPSPVELTVRGKKLARGYKVWPTGVDIGKSELYGWLRLKIDEVGGIPAGFCHFPEHGEAFFQQLTAEHLVTSVNKRTRRSRMEWQVLPNRENHHLDCFDEETEVLTRDGWRGFASLTGAECLATVNLQTDEIEYQAPEALIAKPFSGEMVSLRGRSIDILVTPNHRMVTYKKQRDPKTKRWRFDVPAQITLAKDLTVHHALKRTAKWKGRASATVRVGTRDVDAGDMAEILGWYVSEGYASRTEWRGTVKSRAQTPGARIPTVQVAHSVGICQNPGPKSERIRDLLARTPWKWRTEPKKYLTSSKELHLYVRAEAGSGAANKRVPQWIKDAPPEIIGRFVDAAILGDGWMQDGFRTYATVSAGLADDMQELFLKLGRSANIRRRPAKPWNIEGRSGPAGRDQFHVSELKGGRQYLVRNGAKTPRFLGETVPYDGMVYCAEVPNGTLVCRRRGLAFVAGNCRILARVAVATLGIDRIASRDRARAAAKPAAKVPSVTATAASSSPPAAAETAEPAPRQPDHEAAPRSGFWKGPPRGSSRLGGWFGKRR